MQPTSSAINNKTITVNQRVEPMTAGVNSQNHLTLAGIDVIDLAKDFGTPLWVICEDTVRSATQAIWDGLKDYPQARPSYAGKAFLCLAMAALIKELGFGIDVVSEGELVTAIEAGFPPEKIFLHGNNKSQAELGLAIATDGINIVVDSLTELKSIIDIQESGLAIETASPAKDSGQKSQARVPILVRIIPAIDLDTHDHIKTGHATSKFGIPLSELDEFISLALKHKNSIELLGLHAHIGSQGMDLHPYLQIVDLMAGLYRGIKDRFDYDMPHLDVGGGLGIAYTPDDKPISLTDWARTLSERVKQSFAQAKLPLPELSLEPGRSIIGTAGVTIYQVGHTKELEQGVNYLSVDGGMADNPRPIMYQAKYTAVVANRMKGDKNKEKAWTIVGRYCESGDIIVEGVRLDSKRGDLIAVYATGAYNYSMSSNYNRTARPACVLVKNGKAEVILARETCTDLLRQDRMPSWLTR